MENFDSQKLHKDEYQVRSTIKWVKSFLRVCLIIYAIGSFFSIWFMFTKHISLPVQQSRKPLLISGVINGAGDMSVKVDRGLVFYKTDNIMENLIFDHDAPQFLHFYNLLVTTLVCWLLIRIFTDLNLDKPFSHVISKRITWIGMVLIASSMFNILREFYIRRKIDELLGFGYHYDRQFLNTNSYDLKVGIIVIIIAFVYKKGCLMQQEQALTI